MFKKLASCILAIAVVFALIPTVSSAVTAGEVIKFGNYDWRVLEVKDGKALLLSDKVLEERSYHNTDTDITWETSDIRAYLNDEFFNSFSATEKARIAQVTNTNPDNPWFGTAGGEDTDDHVFLLSLDEVVLYFGDADELAKPEGEREEWWGFSGAHADKRIVRCIVSSCWCHSETYGHQWWLRSPGGGSSDAAGVDDGGSVDVDGYIVNSYLGVRPALWVNLDGTDPPEPPEPPEEKPGDNNVSISVSGNAIAATLTPKAKITLSGGEPFPLDDPDKLTLKVEKKTPENTEAFFTALKAYLS
ncbi:MAG: DUF6273 domain-containing protein [Oscillospiraceae bacterium]|nr:DUF6273 domain-containing protein [Oscillospiraceae bacterium]